MAWEIAVIVDPDCGDSKVDSLATYMPLWIVDTPPNRVYAAKARHAAGELWLPEAACTTFRATNLDAREQNCLNILDTVDLHHSRMAKLNLIGVENSEHLRAGVQEFGFVPARATWGNTIAFRRPVAMLTNVPHLQLDAATWKNTDDVYESIFAALGAPTWHGKNFHALNDSIVTGSINTIEVPYTISIKSMKSANQEVKRFVSDLVDFISDREAEGCPVSIRIDNKLN